MDRRQFIFALIAGAAGMACAAQAGATSRDMTAFVRDIYAQAVDAHAAGMPMSDEAVEAVFSRKTRALMHAPGLDQLPSGPSRHVLFGSVPPGAEVKLGKVAPAFGGAGDLPLVRVDLVIRGNKRQVRVRPVREDGGWRIADIGYGSGSGLVAGYRGITAR
jgi:hypothetical protein